MFADVLLKVAAMKFASEEQKPYYPRPSAAGPERCLRQTTYWASGVKHKPLPGRAVVVFDDSSWHEELTLDLMRQSAFHSHSEQMPITIPDAFSWMPDGTWYCKICDLNIPNTSCHGHIDWIATDMLGIDTLVEHKALNMFTFEALWNNEELPLDYFTQQAIYLRGLQQDNPDLTRGVLLIKNKNTSAYIEFLVSYSSLTDTLTIIEKTHHTGDRHEINIDIPNITNDAFARLRQVEEHRANGTLPDRQYEYDSWRCSYCAFGEMCWAGWADEHEMLATDVELDEETADIMRYEKECAMHESEAKKERAKLRRRIKKMLQERGAKTGKAGEIYEPDGVYTYLVELNVSTRKQLDVEKIPKHVYEDALTEVPTERLKIKKVKIREAL